MLVFSEFFSDFPHLHPLSKSNFFFFAGNYWTSLKNQRAFLDDFAARNDIKPLIAQNWREFSSRKLKKFNVCKEKDKRKGEKNRGGKGGEFSARKLKKN